MRTSQKCTEILRKNILKKNSPGLYYEDQLIILFYSFPSYYFKVAYFLRTGSFISSVHINI